MGWKIVTALLLSLLVIMVADGFHHIFKGKKFSSGEVMSLSFYSRNFVEHLSYIYLEFMYALFSFVCHFYGLSVPYSVFCILWTTQIQLK